MSTPVPALVLSHLSKFFTDVQQTYPAVDDLSLELPQGEIMALLGPSGCGKTTLLRLIAGFENLDAGSITLAGQEVANERQALSPEKRRVGFVFQDYALFPHLTVLQNVLFGLHDKKYNAKAKLERAEEVLELVGLNAFHKRRPHQLSGGQQQRVALARALAPEPAIMLLDEPFSNLDAALRENTRAEIKQILRQTDTTTLLVTHDQEEALTFADRLAVMRLGKLEQIGEPEQVYNQPATAFVALFLGTSNLLDGTVQADGVETALGLLELATANKTQGQQVKLSLRPEALRLQPVEVAARGVEGTRGIEVTIQQRAFKGHDITYYCQDSQGEDYIVHVPVPVQGLQSITEETSASLPSDSDAYTDFREGQPARLVLYGQATLLEA